MEYDARLRRLENRRHDPTYLQKSFSAIRANQILDEAYKTVNYPKSVKYTLGAMAEVDKEYTDNTFREGERIKNHLDDLKGSGFNFSYRYQGSTSNNTHIKAHSDIDILVIQEKFQFNKPSTGSSYPGDWRKDQKELRIACYDKISNVFYTADVDNSGTFSISVTGGSLKRKIDIVPSCWDINEVYNNHPIPENKGIRVYALDMLNYNTNYPFLNNKLIDEKDILCQGNFRNSVRLLKTLKADSNREISINSYDLVSILYHMSNSEFLVGSQFLLLVRRIKEHFLSLNSSPSYYNQLLVPDKTRLISEKVKIDDLRPMSIELDELENDIVNDLSTINKSLNENVNIGRRQYM